MNCAFSGIEVALYINYGPASNRIGERYNWSENESEHSLESRLILGNRKNVFDLAVVSSESISNSSMPVTCKMKSSVSPSLRYGGIIAEAIQGCPPGYALCATLHFSSDSSELNEGKVSKLDRSVTLRGSPADRHIERNLP
jgi:hypothetical protein